MDSISTVSVLAFGFVLGLKHAVDADHLAAVATIASERRSLLSSSINTHHGLRFSARPLLVGMVHGLAGSAALMLLVLSTISQPLLGLLYLVVFGVGSIGGMMVMSTLVSLPAQLTATRFSRANLAVRGLAGLFSPQLWPVHGLRDWLRRSSPDVNQNQGPAGL